MTGITPRDFAAFWAHVDTELASVKPDVELALDQRPASDGVRVHRMAFRSLDGVRVGGWLAVPDRDGPHQALTIFPGYKSDPMPAIGWARRGYAAFTLAHRGKLGSTNPYNPGYPGLLTDGITHPDNYSYRGIYADCMRALEVMADASFTTGLQAVYGYSQGGPLSLFASARRPELVGAVAAGAPFLTAFPYSVLAARTYPYFEIAEYLARHPRARDTVFRTLEYFDAVHAIGDVTAPLLLFRAAADEICPPYSTTLLHARAPQNTRWHEYDESGHDATGVRAVADAAAFFAEILPAPTAVDTPTDRSQLRVQNACRDVPELVTRALAATAARVRSREDRSDTHPAAATTTFVSVATADGATAGAYVSVPTDTDNASAGVVVEFSPYASVVSLAHPEDRERFPIITIAHRGQRGSHLFDEPWMLPGLFDPVRGEPAVRLAQLVADTIQVLHSVLAEIHRPATPVIGVGPDWLLAVAALTGMFTHVEVENFWLTGFDGGPEFEYPRRELHEHARLDPTVASTVSWCDPVYWASQLSCDLLVVCADTPAAKARAALLTDAHSGPHSVRVADVRSAKEGEWRDARRAALLGVSPATRWQAARSGVRV